LPNAEASVADEESGNAQDDPGAVALKPRMRGALDYVSRRYHVSTEALQPIFATAQTIGHELHLDPLLIIAVIGVESGFNPFSQSVFGAQGLMQVVPRFHHDKLPEEDSSFLDPVTNVQVGARVLKESISRNGGLEERFAASCRCSQRRQSALCDQVCWPKSNGWNRQRSACGPH
jgi:soluble lytic murein transglycosylase-like protein